MAVHNNDSIIMVHYEDLPDEDKDTINKVIEEFQNKCLLSYTKTRDSTIIQKFPLPRVLLHGQTDIVEAEEAINKSVRDAISNHNEVFLNTIHNTMKEVFHGFPVDQSIMEMGILIFRQVEVTIVVAENDTPIQLQIKTSNPTILAP